MDKWITLQHKQEHIPHFFLINNYKQIIMHSQMQQYIISFPYEAHIQ